MPVTRWIHFAAVFPDHLSPARRPEPRPERHEAGRRSGSRRTSGPSRTWYPPTSTETDSKRSKERCNFGLKDRGLRSFPLT